MSRYSPSALLGVVDLPLAFPFAILQGVLVLGWVLPAAVIPIQALKLLGDAQNVSAFFFGVGFVGLFGALVMPWLVYAMGRRAIFALGAVCIGMTAAGSTQPSTRTPCRIAKGNARGRSTTPSRAEGEYRDKHSAPVSRMG